jgi:ribA/ribD-fused uncharacterized protein
MNISDFSIGRPLPPLWMMFPHIPYRSIGWRMGDGEAYLFAFNMWFDSLTKAEQEQYTDMFPRPKSWICKDYAPEVAFWNPCGEAQYSYDKLVAQPESTNEFVFFWQAGDAPEACFSQWQYSPFKYQIHNYCWAEQYMMAAKAHIFHDSEMEKQILASNSPREIKIFGRKVSGFSDKVWNSVKYSIVLNGNYAKFSQNHNMREILLSTGDKILAEASPLDTIWGIGLSSDHPNAEAPLNWCGTNLLGFALMEVRDELRRVYKSYDSIDWDSVKNITF